MENADRGSRSYTGVLENAGEEKRVLEGRKPLLLKINLPSDDIYTWRRKEDNFFRIRERKSRKGQSRC